MEKPRIEMVLSSLAIGTEFRRFGDLLSQSLADGKVREDLRNVRRLQRSRGDYNSNPEHSNISAEHIRTLCNQELNKTTFWMYPKHIIRRTVSSG